MASCYYEKGRGTMFAKLLCRILICLFIAVGVSSLATAQENDRAALIERAKKEGEVVWYTSAGLQDSNPMAEAFQKDYPFIRISVISGRIGSADQQDTERSQGAKRFVRRAEYQR